MATVTVTQEQGIGYSGKRGQRAYIARITGIDTRYGLQREFLDAVRVERDHWGRARYVRTLTYELGPGLYEEQSEGDRGIHMVWARRGEAVWSGVLSDTRINAILRLLDAGQDFEAARIATRPPKPAPAPIAREA